MKTDKRVEWRGDLFATDLERFLVRLAEVPVVHYQLPYTLTIFLQQRSTAFDLDRIVRVRSYCDLPDLDPESVDRAVAAGLSAKLQVKAVSGATTELLNGRVALPLPDSERSGDGWRRIQFDGRILEAASVRVARRVHYELPRRHRAAPVRVTVDHERALFRVVQGTLRPLGEMGPRVEIKSTDAEEVDRVVRFLDRDGALRRVQYRSLELLFQDLLRDLVPPEPATVRPEIESKFVMARIDLAAAASAVVGWLRRHQEVRLLLPFPHQIVRMRRYHFCESPADDAQCTIVETAAGRLSAKIKRGATTSGSALVRQTQASRWTDRDGRREPVAAFAHRHGWRTFNTMTKVQAKIPLALATGNAYLVSVDDCVDLHGASLRQLELEYIGSMCARPTIAEVCGELEALGDLVQHALPALELLPTTESKFAFYRHISR